MDTKQENPSARSVDEEFLATIPTSLSQDLHTKGWERLDLLAHPHLRELVAGAATFFNLPQDEKASLGGVRAVHLAGYYATDLRQQLEVRHDVADPKVLSPAIGDVCPSFAQAVRRAWPLLEAVAIKTLRASAEQMGVDPEVFLELMESSKTRRLRKKDQPSGTLSVHSIRFCRYHDAPVSEEGHVVCPAHTDVGLATLILNSATPGLECQEPDGKWTNVENKQEGHNSGAVWLVADCLRTITNGYYRAAPHRVVRAPSSGGGRISISFHLYCDPHAVLDPALLPAHVVGAAPPAASRASSVALDKKKSNAAETRKAGQE